MLISMLKKRIPLRDGQGTIPVWVLAAYFFFMLIVIFVLLALELWFPGYGPSSWEFLG